jgi:hypothetical protein
VSKATRNFEEVACGARGEVQAPSEPISRIAKTMDKKVHCRQAESFGQSIPVFHYRLFLAFGRKAE